MSLASKLDELRRTLAARSERPVAFRDVTEVPWGDRELGRRFLRVGRRTDQQTEREVGFLIERLALGEGSRVLDVMCGDGRIALPLAQHGCLTTGVDINPYAIECAQYHAEVLGLAQRARFQCADARTLELGAEYDAALCIFGQLSGFIRTEAADILRRLRAGLAAAGRVVIDMHLGPAALCDLDQEQHWELYPDGWLGTDHAELVLDEYLTDADALTFVRRSYCLDLVTGDTQVFGQAGQFYDATEMERLLADAGLRLEALLGDFDGRPYDDATSPNLIVLARA